MIKFISASLMALISIQVFSQDNSLIEISQKVKDLISRHGDQLDQNDQMLVRKNLSERVKKQELFEDLFTRSRSALISV